MTCAAIESQISVAGMPRRCSSQAVKRAPCNSGRVSSTKTCTSLSLILCGEEHRQRRAVFRGSQPPGIAVRQHTLSVTQQLRSVPTNRAAHLPVFVVDLTSQSQQCRRETGRLPTIQQFFTAFPDAIQWPRTD